jgi:hypothetical protein
MRFTRIISAVCALALVAGCGQAPPPKVAETPAKPPEPVFPAEITAVAQSVLGAEAEVLVFGDLARNGHQQVLVINRLPKTPAGQAPGILLTRAVIVENADAKWREVLRCDEHLKNPNGFLGGAPAAPVNGWRLQYEQDAQKGLELYFTPLNQAGAAHPTAIGVRWDPQVKRYRSLDRNYENFLGEAPVIEKINSYLK